MEKRKLDHLNDEHLECYHRDGFVALRGVFGSDEIDHYREAAEELKTRVSPIQPGKPRLQIEPKKDAGEYCLRMVEPLIDLNSVFLYLADDPRITGPVQKIFGEKALLLIMNDFELMLCDRFDLSTKIVFFSV